MTTTSRRKSVLGLLAALLTGLAGFFAFNVVDGVFGQTQAILGIAACIAATVFVFRRSPSREEDADV